MDEYNSIHQPEHLDDQLDTDFVQQPTKTKRIYPTLAATLITCYLFIPPVLAGDGSDEPGFVQPPEDRKLPPPPPRTVSSAETYNACCCCPVTPMSRTEAKKPPEPPVAVIKLKH